MAAAIGAGRGRFSATAARWPAALANVVPIGPRLPQEATLQTLNVPADVAPVLAEVRAYANRLRQFHQRPVTTMIVIAIAAIVDVIAGGRLRLPWVIVGFTIGLSAFDSFGRGLWLERDEQERSLRAALALQPSC